jgi:hypothetical protein
LKPEKNKWRSKKYTILAQKSDLQKGKRKKREIERQKERDTDTGKERGREIA